MTPLAAVSSIITDGIEVISSIWSGFWTFVTGNPVVAILIFAGLVGAGIKLFLHFKSRMTRK